MPFPRGGKLDHRGHGSTASSEDALFPNADKPGSLSSSTKPRPKRKPNTKHSSSPLTGLTSRTRSTKRNLSTSSTSRARASKRARADAQVYQLLPGKIRPGLLVYGVVKQVGDRYAVVSLANNVNGIVSAERVSDSLSSASSMSDLLHVGSYVRCAVVSAGRTEQGGMRIELSTQASLVNKGMTVTDLRVGSLVAGNVKSIEDHGFLIALGIGKAQAFLRFDAAGCSQETPCFSVGEPVEAVVMSQTKPVVLSMAAAALRGARLKAAKKLGFSAIRPGCLVTAKVTAVLRNGIRVSFLDGFTGFVHRVHLSQELEALVGEIHASEDSSEAMEQRLREVKEFSARVIFLDVEKKGVGLSVSRNVVNRESRFETLATFHGRVVDGTKVKAVEPGRGIYLDLDLDLDMKQDLGLGLGLGEGEGAENKDVAVFVPASNVAIGDRKVPCERFEVGTAVKWRCVDVSYLDACLYGSMVQSVVAAEVLTYKDLQVGQEVTAEVMRLQPYGLLVHVGHRLKALVPTIQMGDVEVRNPQKRFKAGTKVKAKVLSIKYTEEGARVQLTLKKSLLRSKLEIVSDVDEVEAGSIVHGFVSSIREKQGVHVTFYNGVHGLIGLSDLAAFGVEDMEESYKIGQVLRVRVVGKSASHHALRLSLRTSGEFGNGSSLSTLGSGQFSIGDIVTGKVLRRQKDGTLLLRVKPLSKASSSASETTAVLPVAHCSDHNELAPQLAKHYLSPGRAIPKAVVLRGDASGLLTVSIKPLLVKAVVETQAQLAVRVPRGLSEVHEDEMLAGVVCKVSSLGVFVEFLGGLTALAPRANVADVWVSDPSSFFTVGQTVLCRAVHVNQGQRKFIVSLKSSVIAKAELRVLSQLFLRSLMEERRLLRSWKRVGANDVDVGGKLVGKVVEMKEYGVAVKVINSAGGEDETLAFCIKDNLGKDAPKLGEDVTGRVLDAESVVIDISMRPSTLQTEIQHQPGLKEGLAQSDLKPMDATIELVKPEYAVIFVPKLGCLGLAPSKSFNGEVPGMDALKVGIRCKATLVLPNEDEPTDLLPVFEIQSEGGVLRQKRPRSRSDSISTPERKELKLGEVVRVQVRDISPAAMSLTLLNVRRRKRNKGSIAQIHCCDMSDKPEASKAVFDGISVGSIFDARIVQMERKGDRLGVYLSTKQSDLNASFKDGEGVDKALKVEADKSYSGVVEKVVQDGVVVALSRGVKGFIFCTRLSDDLQYLDSVFNQNDEACKKKLLGTGINVRVLSIDETDGHVDLAPEPLMHA